MSSPVKPQTGASSTHWTNTPPLPSCSPPARSPPTAELFSPPPPRDTLENQANSRENRPLIVVQYWIDGRQAAETWSFRCSNGVQFALLNAYRPRYEQREPPVILSYRGKQYPLYPFTGASWWGFFSELGSDGAPIHQPGFSVQFYRGTSLQFNDTKIGTQCQEITPGV